MRTATHDLQAQYDDLFDALAADGIACCLLRPRESLGHGDIDLLVDPDRRTEALATLARLGFRIHRGEFLNPRKIVLGKWTADGHVCIDLHLAVVQGGLEYLDAKRVLERSVDAAGVAEPCAADMAVVLIVHDLLGKRRLQDKHRDAVTRALPALTGEPGIAEMLPQTRPELDRLYDDPAAAARLARLIERRLARQHRGRLLLLRLKRFIARPTRGISLCLLGPDGSGKSATMSHLAEVLRDELGWGVETRYMGPWGHYHFPRLMRWAHEPVPATIGELFAERRAAMTDAAAKPSTWRALRWEWRRRRRPLDEDQERERRFHRNTTVPWLLWRWVRGHVRYWFYLCALFFELWWRYAWVWRAKRRGRVVLCDRYIYDFISGAMHDITPRYRWARSLMCALYPRPNRTYLLSAAPELLVERKQDLDLPTMKAMQALYDDLSRRWNMARVTTDSPTPDVVRGILDRDYDLLVEMRQA